MTKLRFARVAEQMEQQRLTMSLGQVTCPIDSHAEWCPKVGQRCPDCGAVR